MHRLTCSALVLSTAATVALAGCSSSGSAGSTTTPSASAASASTTAHNAADVTFATDMIPHHRQALEMTAFVASRAADQRVVRIAATITAEQTPEIATMTGWLRSWNKPVPAASASDDMGSMGGMDMGGHSEGMMSAADMTQLSKSTGAAFDRLWVSMMITHHQGAVTMARTELAHGRFAASVALATSIVKNQTAEIAQLKQLLVALPAA